MEENQDSIQIPPNIEYLREIRKLVRGDAKVHSNTIVITLTSIIGGLILIIGGLIVHHIHFVIQCDSKLNIIEQRVKEHINDHFLSIKNDFGVFYNSIENFHRESNKSHSDPRPKIKYEGE